MHTVNKKLGNILKYTLSLILAGVLVYFACRGVNWQVFMEGLRATNWFWIACFFAASYCALIFRAMRWKQLLRPLDPDIHYGRVWDVTNIGALCSIAIPTSGEFLRCAMLTSPKLPFQKVFGTILMERAWDIAVVFVIFFAALFLGWGRFGGFFIDNIWHPLTDRALFLWIILALVLAVVAFFLAVRRLKERSRFFAKMDETIRGFLEGFATFARIRNKLPFLLNTLGVWGMYYLMTYFVLKAIPDLSHLNAGDGLFVASIGNIGSAIPVPGGIGAYHYLLRSTLSVLYGASNEIGLLFATLSHELHAVLVIVLGAWSYIMRVVILKNRNAKRNN